MLENLLLGISMTLSQHVKELLDQFYETGFFVLNILKGYRTISG